MSDFLFLSRYQFWVVFLILVCSGCGPWQICEFAGVTLTLRRIAFFADEPSDNSMVSRCNDCFSDPTYL